MALKRAVCGKINRRCCLLAAGVLGDSLGALTDGVLGQFTGQKETDSGLDLSACDGRSLVVVGKSRCLGSDSLEDVVDKAVHDGHGFAGHTGIGVDLLQDFVDVDRVGFPPPPLPLLVGGTGGLRLSGGLLVSLACNSLCWHDDILANVARTPNLFFIYRDRRIDLLTKML